MNGTLDSEDVLVNIGLITASMWMWAVTTQGEALILSDSTKLVGATY